MGCCCSSEQKQLQTTRSPTRSPDSRYSRISADADTGEDGGGRGENGPEAKLLPEYAVGNNSPLIRLKAGTSDSPTLLQLSLASEKESSLEDDSESTTMTRKTNLSRHGALRRRETAEKNVGQEPVQTGSAEVQPASVVSPLVVNIVDQNAEDDFRSRSGAVGQRETTSSSHSGEDSPVVNTSTASTSAVPVADSAMALSAPRIAGTPSGPLVDVLNSDESSFRSRSGAMQHRRVNNNTASQSATSTTTATSADLTNSQASAVQGAASGSSGAGGAGGQAAVAETSVDLLHVGTDECDGGSTGAESCSGVQIIAPTVTTEAATEQLLPSFATSDVPMSGFTPPRTRSATNESGISSSSSSRLDQSPQVHHSAVASRPPSKLASSEPDTISFLSELGFGPGQVIERQLLDHDSVGEVDLVLEVTSTAMNIEVKVLKDTHLPELNHNSEVYIKCYLQQGVADTSKHLKKRTNAIEFGETVHFNETLHFKMSPLMDVVKVMLWEDKFGRNIMYGTAVIQLSQLDGNDTSRTSAAPRYRSSKQTVEGTYTLFAVKEDTHQFGLKPALSSSTLTSTKSLTSSFRQKKGAKKHKK